MIKVTLQSSEERIVNKLYETSGCPLGETRIPISLQTQKQIPGGLKI